jgi:hypothetical protein
MRGLTTTRGRRLALLAVALVTAAGCSTGRYPVTGRVVYTDGSPLTEGTVVAEAGEGAEKVMAQGDVRPDGTFEWGTLRPGDGARPGRYRVAVLPRALGDAEASSGVRPAVDGRFTHFETSGIVFDVKEGRNELPITVTKPGPKRRGE